MADAIVPTQTTVMLSISGSSGPVAVTVVSDAAAAAQLLDGMMVEGEAQTRATKGLLEVVTANGVLQLKAAPGATLPAIPAGARLTLQMVGQGDSGQLFLVGVNGRVLGGGPALPNLGGLLNQGGVLGGPALADTATGGRALAGATAAGGSGTATPGALGLTATVIRPALPGQTLAGPTMAGTPAGLPLDMPAGTRLTVRIAGIELPTAPGSAPSSPVPSAGQGGMPGATGAQPAMPGGPATPQPGMPQAGSPVQTAPGQGIPTTVSPGAAPAGTILTGTVTAQPPNGQAVVQTAVATLSVPTQGDLPVGARLTLEVVGAPQPPLPAPPVASRPEGLGALGWPALSEALDTLATSNQPQALEQLLRAIPQPDTRLAAAMVAFTGAVRDGATTRALVPESAVRGLEKAGKKDVAARLRGDLEALTEESGRPVGNGEWRAFTMPMLHGGVVEPVRLFVRRPNGDDDSANGRNGGRGDKANDHRFVLDFKLTQLGRLQLDGLVRREDKLFDLIIRTDQPISSDMRRDILGIFTDASELVGTKGTVNFQSGGRWMEFPPAPPAPTRIEV
ncbi:MAG: hypothetical protein ACM31D_06160 [Bacteroidota bacterium]